MSLRIRTEQVGLEESINDVVNRINRRGVSVKMRASDYTQPLGRITQKADEFTKSLEASNARVIAFGASAAIIGSVTIAFKELVVQAVRVEKILTDINVVLGTSQSSLVKFGQDLFNVARNTSQALDVAAEAALEFSRQGLTMEETLRRTNDALILTRLTGIDAASAVSGLTAAVNGFADAGLSTTSIINKLAAVDVKFAVSAEDLIDALARAGAVAQDAGVNFDQLVGAVTAAQQITARGGAVIGNSFKTIFTRIQRSSTLDRLEELGVAVRDIRGSTLPALTVLSNLSKSYDQLGASTKAAVAEQVGGVFQINVLKAALKDLNRENSLYAQATDISSRATDQAQKKNEMLQQTLSSLAKQTSLSVEELASNIGNLALSPGISKILDAVNSFAQGLNDMLGGGEDAGSSFAKGVVRGIGNVLMGPGVILAFGVFAKLFSNALKFAKASLKDVVGIVTAKDKERMIQESIVVAMSENRQLAIELNKHAGNKEKSEAIMLGIIQKQTAFLEKQEAIARRLAPTLAQMGVKGDLTMPKAKTTSKNQSSGFVPNYSVAAPTPIEQEKEKSLAVKAGYSPGKVKKMNINGIGDVVYNDAETVKRFQGMKQPAIMPPENSKAGKKYSDTFNKKHGFDPYSETGGSKNNSSYSDGLIPVDSILHRKKKEKDDELGSQNNPSYPLGLIPNFASAQKIGQLLKLPKAKMHVQTSATEDYRGNLVRGWKTLTADISELKGRGAANLSPALQELEKMGVKKIQRSFYFSDQDKKGRASAGRNANSIVMPRGKANEFNNLKGNVYEQTLGKNLQDKKFIRTHTQTHKLKKKGLPKKAQNYVVDKKGKGDPSATVDFVREGRIPMEAKAGSFSEANLIAKSLYLHSDKSLDRFLKSAGSSETADQYSKIKLERQKSTLSKMGIDPNEDNVAKFRLAGGHIPNFMDPRSRAQKIKDVLRDPANKNITFKMPSKQHFKAKSMWDQDMLREFASNPKQSYLGGSLKDYLLRKGYNKKELDALARNPDGYNIYGEGLIPNFAKKGVRVEKILEVKDGDSVVGSVQTRDPVPVDHRLSDVDAIESWEPLGDEATKIAQKYYTGTRGATNLEKNIVQGGSGSYNRGLFRDGTLAKELVEMGLGIPDLRYTGMSTYKSSMQSAKSRKRGIWAKGQENHPKRLAIQSQLVTLSGKNQNRRLGEKPEDTEYAYGSQTFTKEKLAYYQEHGPEAYENKYGRGSKSQIKALKGSLYVGRSKKSDFKSDGFVPNYVSMRRLMMKGKSGFMSAWNKSTDKIKYLMSQGLSKSMATQLSKLKPDQIYKRLQKQSSSMELTDSSRKGIDNIIQRASEGKKSLFHSNDPAVLSIAEQVKSNLDKKYPVHTSHGFTPNFKLGSLIDKYKKKKRGEDMGKDDFNATSTAISSFNTSNALFAKTALSGSKGIKLTQRNYEKIRQFLNSKEFRELPKAIQNKVKSSLKKQSYGLKMPDVTRPWLQHYDESFPGQIAASRGLIPSFALDQLQNNKKDQDKPDEVKAGSKNNPYYAKGFDPENLEGDKSLFAREGSKNNPYYWGGLIPNYNKALSDAIKREKDAGIPSSLIRVESDESLKNPMNPKGLAVTNTIDEPAGVRQGIQRAREMGIDPQTHGASSGLIPNFGDKSGPAKIGKIKFKEGVSEDVQNEYIKTKEAINNLTKSANEGSDATTDLTGRLFGLTTVTYMLEGAFSEVEGSTGQWLKSFTGFAQGASQAALTFEALSPMTAGLSDKLTKWGSSLQGTSGFLGKSKGVMGTFVKSLGGAAKSLPLIGSVVAGVIPIFSALKENTGLFDSGLDKLNKSAQKTAKSIEAVGSAMEATKSVQATQKQITDLTNSGQANTYQGQMKLMSLNSTLIKNQSTLQQSALSLAKELNLSGDELQAMTSGTAQGMSKLQEAMTKLTIRQSVTAAATSMDRKDSLGLVSKDFGTVGDSRFKGELGAGGMKLRRKSNEELFQENFDRKDRINFRSGALNLSNTMNIAGVEKQDALGQMSKFQRMNNGDNGKDLDLMEAYANEIADVNQPLSEFVLQLMASGRSAEHIRTTLSLINPIYQKVADEGEKISKENEIQASISKEVNRAKQGLLHKIDIQAKIFDMQSNLLKQSQGYNMERLSYEAKLNASIGLMSESAEVEAQLGMEAQQIKDDYNNKLRAANGKAIQAQDKMIANLFAGSKDKTGANFALLNEDLTQEVPSGASTGSSGAPHLSAAGEQKIEIVAKSGEEGAFEGNREKIAKQLEDASMSELAAKIRTVQGVEDANRATMEYLTNIDDSARRADEISKLGDMNMVSQENVNQALEKIASDKAIEVNSANASKALADENLKDRKKQIELDRNGLAAAKARVVEFQKIKDVTADQKNKMMEQINTEIEQGKISQSINASKRELLKNSDIQAGLIQAQTVALENQLTTDLETLAKKQAKLDAENAQGPEGQKLRDLTAQTIQGEVGVQRSGIPKQIRDAKTESEAKFKPSETGQNMFQEQAGLNLTNVQIAGDELAAQFAADAAAGVHLEESLNAMAEESRTFVKSINDFSVRLANQDFATKARQEVITGATQSMAKSQKSKGMGEVITASDFTSPDGTTAANAALQKELVGLTGYQAQAKIATRDLATETNNLKSTHAANVEFGLYAAQATKSMAEETIAYQATMAQTKKRLEESDFATKALQKISQDGMQAKGETQAVEGKRGIITDPESPFEGMTGYAAEVQTKMIRLGNSAKELEEQYKANKEAGFYDEEATKNLSKAKVKAKEAQDQFEANLKAGRFEFDAFEEMNEASRDFTKEMIKAKTKLAAGEFYREGQRDVERNQISKKGAVEQALGTRDTYAAAGNDVRAAEETVNVATSMREYNKEMGQGSLLLDTWKVKMAEANERLANFGQTLGETSFDAVRDGFKGMLQDISDGTKSTSEIMMGFIGGIAKKMQDKMFDRAADQMTSGLANIMGLEQYHTGGFVRKFAKGGSTGQEVPAMLTDGEYVVRKKIVDKLGVNTMNKINRGGDLEELYNKPNEDNFELLNAGGMVSPPILRMVEGGNVDKNLQLLMNQKNSDTGSQNERSSETENLAGVFNDFAGLVKAFHGGMIFMRDGGLTRKEQDRRQAYSNVGSSAGMLTGTALARKKKGDDNPAPTAPKAPTSLNTASRLNIDPRSSQMSARFRKNDQYSKDYEKYLFDKEAHRVQKHNEKIMERKQTWQAVADVVSMTAATSLGNYVGDKINPTSTETTSIGSSPSQNTANNTNSPNSGKSGRDWRNEVVISQGHDGSPTTEFKNGKVVPVSQKSTPISSFKSNNSPTEKPFVDPTIARYEARNRAVDPTNSVAKMDFSGDNQNSRQSRNFMYTPTKKAEGGLIEHYFQGGPIRKFAEGGLTDTGKVNGPSGIDKVGPVMLDKGEYVIKASSVSNVEKQYPGFFDRLNTMKFNQGGLVKESPTEPTVNNENSETNNNDNSNITVNITVSGGNSTVEGGGAAEQDLGSRIKDAVVSVMAQEKRVGGMLRG